MEGVGEEGNTYKMHMIALDSSPEAVQYISWETEARSTVREVPILGICFPNQNRKKRYIIKQRNVWEHESEKDRFQKGANTKTKNDLNLQQRQKLQLPPKSPKTHNGSNPLRFGRISLLVSIDSYSLIGLSQIGRASCRERV